MTQVTVQKTIDAPREKVFETFSDLRNADKNVPGILRCEVVTDGEIGVGTRWRETRVMFGKEHTEEMAIVAFTPQEGYVVSASSHGSDYRTEFIFREEGDSTNVTMIFGATPLTLAAKAMTLLMGSMMMGSVRRLIEEDMEALKQVCEERGP